MLELRVVVTATGKIQDLSSTDSLEGTVMVWLAYVFVSVLISGALLSACRAALASAPEICREGGREALGATSTYGYGRRPEGREPDSGAEG